MPKPKKGEKKNKYISRCIRTVRHEGEEQKQAVGKCYGMWDHYSKNEHIKTFNEYVNEKKSNINEE